MLEPHRARVKAREGRDGLIQEQGADGGGALPALPVSERRRLLKSRNLLTPAPACVIYRAS